MNERERKCRTSADPISSLTPSHRRRQTDLLFSVFELLSLPSWRALAPARPPPCIRCPSLPSPRASQNNADCTPYFLASAFVTPCPTHRPMDRCSCEVPGGLLLQHPNGEGEQGRGEAGAAQAIPIGARGACHQDPAAGRRQGGEGVTRDGLKRRLRRISRSVFFFGDGTFCGRRS